MDICSETRDIDLRLIMNLGMWVVWYRQVTTHQSTNDQTSEFLNKFINKFFSNPFRLQATSLPHCWRRINWFRWGSRGARCGHGRHWVPSWSGRAVEADWFVWAAGPPSSGEGCRPVPKVRLRLLTSLTINTHQHNSMFINPLYNILIYVLVLKQVPIINDAVRFILWTKCQTCGISKY